MKEKVTEKKQKSRTFLYICAHPDDDIEVGGTMKKLADSGWLVHEIVCTPGKNAISGTGEITSEQIKHNRIKEVSLYCELLGAQKPIVLDSEKRIFAENEEMVFAVTKIMRAIRPDVTVLMNKEDYHFEHTVSHLIGARAFEFACRKTCPELGEPLKTGILLQSDGLNVLPNPLITFNTSSTHSAKIEASKIAYDGRIDDYLNSFAEGQAMMRGSRVGFKYGESYDFLNPTWFKFKPEAARILNEFVEIGS
ncbi:PIG-L family deacetylase [candidate division WWE3 bacterium]|nr:PIG-L family deacetylase [candidate division WWE3 bacterium]